MKSKIKLSSFSLWLTIIMLVVMVAACVATFDEPAVFYCLLPIPVILLVCIAYAPLSIRVDNSYITVVRLLKNRKILMRNVESVQLFQPTLGAIRIWASGGFMGYWGIFREGDIGRYEAFYGKASDCFLVRMKNGDKYVLGCENPAAMVEFIKSKIAQD